jgi:hypothetical protein
MAGVPPPTNGVPVLEGVAVTVMITLDRFATIRRAARRAVRKYDLAYVAIGRENCSTSSSTRGTRTFGFGMPIALKEMSTRPALVGHGPQMLVHRLLVEGVDLRRVGGSASGTDVRGDNLDGYQGAPSEKHVGTLRRKRACDRAADRASGSVDHRDLVLQHHLWFLSGAGGHAAHLVS